MISDLSPTEHTVYQLLTQKAGEIVTYDEFGRVISCKRDRRNLITVIYNLRSKIRGSGYMIENRSQLGYRLKATTKRVPVLALTEESQEYATDMESAVRTMLSDYTEVDFETKIGILGVAIGAILHQLPQKHRAHYTRILMRNIAEAPKFVQTENVQ